MKLQELADLIINKKEGQIPHDVSIEDMKYAYMLAYGNRKFQHELEKEDEFNYGYLGSLRLRDTLPTFQYVKAEREEIAKCANSYDENIYKIAYIYDYFVKNFTINLDYVKAFNYYYKNYGSIFTKSDKEIKTYFEKVNEYLHPFKEIEIDGKKFYANTRVDLFETRCACESIIASEFVDLVQKVIPQAQIETQVGEENHNSFTLININLGTRENPIRMNFIPTKDIFEKQTNNVVEHNYFNVPNDKLIKEFTFNNETIPADTNKFDTKEIMNGLNDKKNLASSNSLFKILNENDGM